MSRKLARETSFKLVFEYIFSNQKNPLTLEDFLVDAKLNEDDANYVKQNYEGITANYDQIIKIIEDNLKGYTLNRVYKVDLAILCLAVYEIKFAKTLDPKIVINEAVELSKKFSTDKSFSFVNGVLAAINKGE